MRGDQSSEPVSGDGLESVSEFRAIALQRGLVVGERRWVVSGHGLPVWPRNSRITPPPTGNRG